MADGWEGKFGDRTTEAFVGVFAGLTPKQREVLALVAEHRTSKEIAWRIGISESAVNQRIESIRGRVGSLPRAELARAYHQHFVSSRGFAPATGHEAHASGASDAIPLTDPIGQPGAFALADPPLFELAASRDAPRAGSLVPEVLDGPDMALNRVAAMLVIAGGLLTVAMVGLAVAQTLTALL